MSDTFAKLNGTGYVRLSDFNQAARILRGYLVENGAFETIPLTATPVKYREGRASADAYFISYETLLAYQKANPETPLQITGIKSSSDFHSSAAKAVKNSQSIFEGNTDAIIITMNERGGEPGTCYVAISPAAEKLVRETQLNTSRLFQPTISGPLQNHLKEMWGEWTAQDFREGKGAHVKNEGFRKGDKSPITDRTEEGEIVWLGDKSVAAVSPDTALKLKAHLFPNNGHIIQRINSKTLSGQHGRIFEDVRTNNTFYRVENNEVGREKVLFTIIPDHAVRFLDIDEHGCIDGLRKPLSSSFTTVTQAWLYTDFENTKIFLTNRAEKVVNQMRFALSGEQESIIRRMLGSTAPDKATMQGHPFSPEEEKPIDKRDRPKGLSIAETVSLTARFNPQGQTTDLDIEFSERPHLSQLIIERSKTVTIKAGKKEFVLAAA